MWGTDMSQMIPSRKGAGLCFRRDRTRELEIIGIHATGSANRFEALEPVGEVYRCFGSIARRGAWAQAASRSLAPITCPAISRARSNVWASKLRRPSCANPRAMASPSASSNLEGELAQVRTFKTIEELRQLVAFARRYNETWLVARHGYKTPARSERSKPWRQLRLTRRCATNLTLGRLNKRSRVSQNRAALH